MQVSKIVHLISSTEVGRPSRRRGPQPLIALQNTCIYDSIVNVISTLLEIQTVLQKCFLFMYTYIFLIETGTKQQKYA
jgi:hypothetical protein